MKVEQYIKKAFPPSGGATSLHDKYSEYSLRFESVIDSTTSFEELKEFLKIIPKGDNWSLNAIIAGDSIPLSSTGDAVSSFKGFDESINLIEGGTPFTLDFHLIKARNNGVVNIYDFRAFEAFLGAIGPISFLEVVKDDLKENRPIQLTILDEQGVNFYSNKFLFLSAGLPKPEITDPVVVTLDNSCDFNRKNDFPFSPDYFRLLKKPENHPVITDAFNCLFSILLLAGILDIITLSKKELYYRLSGFRILEGTLSMTDVSLESSETYYKIYEWIYSEPTKVADKLGLTRNILSSYLKSNSLEIEASAYQSIISGYKVYLKENLTKYLDLRSKINDELSEISKKANDVINDYLGNYQKSSLTFISFFISVFVLKFISGAKLEGMFGKEATILSFFFIGLSLVYLIFSGVILVLEKRRLDKRYERLKGRFKDLLHEKDIETILRKDEEFKGEISFVKARGLLYTVLWIITLIGILAAVISLSSYVNWETFWHR